MKAIIFIGATGTGKTTIAKYMVSQHPGKYAEVDLIFPLKLLIAKFANVSTEYVESHKQAQASKHFNALACIGKTYHTYRDVLGKFAKVFEASMTPACWIAMAYAKALQKYPDKVLLITNVYHASAYKFALSHMDCKIVFCYSDRPCDCKVRDLSWFNCDEAHYVANTCDLQSCSHHAELIASL